MNKAEPSPPRALALLPLLAFAALCLWEGGLAVLGPRRAPTTADWQAAAAQVRAGFQPGDLIVIAPAWAAPLGREVLGDLMPISMIGRPDAARYPRIWEVAARGARAPEATALTPEWQGPAGRVTVARYRQAALTVTYDFVAHYQDATVTQARLAGGDDERPCFFVPAPRPGHGDPSAFRCAGSRVERRTMEIDYQPRYGIVVPAEQAQATRLRFADIPDDALRGATLWLWAGLHDYYARKTQSGPADVTVAIDGQPRASLRVQPEQGLQLLKVPIPPLPPGAHAVTLQVSAADARARNVGLIAELRR